MKPDPSLDIAVSEGVYAPSDDSFLLLSAIQICPGQRVLDVGTGTGIIALHCAKLGAEAVATDISPGAVRCARFNARANGIDIDVVQTDLANGLRGGFDAVVFNPPYLGCADTEALSEGERAMVVGGASGSETSIRFLKDADRLLAEGGRLYLLASSASVYEVLEFSKPRFCHALVAEKPLFFERLAVYELRPR